MVGPGGSGWSTRMGRSPLTPGRARVPAAPGRHCYANTIAGIVMLLVSVFMVLRRRSLSSGEPAPGGDGGSYPCCALRMKRLPMWPVGVFGHTSVFVLACTQIVPTMLGRVSWSKCHVRSGTRFRQTSSLLQRVAATRCCNEEACRHAWQLEGDLRSATPCVSGPALSFYVFREFHKFIS